jgi:hypothetical protein
LERFAVSEDSINPFAFLFPSKEEVERRAAQTQMSAQAFYHEMTGFLEKQSDEDLVMLYTLLGLASDNGDRLCGLIEGTLSGRGFCFACQTRHDKSIDEILDTPAESKEAETETTSDFQAMGDDKKLLDEYNVIRAMEYPKVTCKGCGMVYQSLEDRMLRRPGQCEGCQHKAKWG